MKKFFLLLTIAVIWSMLIMAPFCILGIHDGIIQIDFDFKPIEV